MADQVLLVGEEVFLLAAHGKRQHIRPEERVSLRARLETRVPCRRGQSARSDPHRIELPPYLLHLLERAFVPDQGRVGCLLLRWADTATSRPDRHRAQHRLRGAADFFGARRLNCQVLLLLGDR